MYIINLVNNVIILLKKQMCAKFHDYKSDLGMGLVFLIRRILYLLYMKFHHLKHIINILIPLFNINVLIIIKQTSLIINT